MDNPISRAEHEEFRKRLEEHNSRQDKRIELLEGQTKQNGALLASVERLAASMENMQKEQNRQGERLDALENRDGEMWRKVVSYVATAAVGAVIAFIFAQIGISG